MTSGLPPAHDLRRTLVHAGRAGIVALVAVSLAVLPAQARGDQLDDHKRKVDAALAQSRSDIDEYSKDAVAAAAALSDSQQKLADAQAKLAQAQSALAKAQALDAERAAELDTAQKQLAKAQADATKAGADVDAFHRKVGARAREAMQQGTELEGITTLLTTANTGQVGQKLQWNTTIFDSSSRQMDRLRELKLKRDAAQAEATTVEARVAGLRKAAAAQLATTTDLAGQATQARNQVASATAELASAKSKADSTLAGEKARAADLAREQTSVNNRIKERIARQKAEAARKAAAERARQKAAAEARRKAAAAAAARAARAAKARAAQRAHSSTRAQGPVKRRTTTSRSVTSRPAAPPRPSLPTFSYPVNGPITSGYGMRLHPVLHYWKLHDGTDFGAACGAPIRAPRAGVVAEKYYNVGYGNRLMIDHGVVDGHYLTTGYNHATHYIVGVGQRVERGQVIGYVGTTGFSTGCHLHLMVWQDGDVVNPMRWF